MASRVKRSRDCSCSGDARCGPWRRALPLCSCWPARLIICDYHLGADELGTEVVQQIRGHSGAATPAVILSPDVGKPLREATAAAGLHLLHKPLNPARLRVLLMHVAAGPHSGAGPTQGAAGSDL